MRPVDRARAPRHLVVACLFAAIGCSSQESPRVELPVVVDGAEAARAVTTNLGYRVVISRLRVAVRDLQLTVGGEAHAARPAAGPRALARAISRLVLGTAHAHPGHLAGGEVTGELGGPLLFDWTADGAPLGTATLLVGSYQGASFFFRRTVAEELGADDSLAGHTLEIAAEVERDGRRLGLSAILDLDEGAPMVGAPFQLEVTVATDATLGLRLFPADPTDGAKTIWNGVDFFAAADAAGPGATTLSIVPGQDAHNVIRRAFVVHDFYEVITR